MIDGVWNKEHLKHYKLVSLKNQQTETNRKLDIIANHLGAIEERLSAIENYLSESDV